MSRCMLSESLSSLGATLLYRDDGIRLTSYRKLNYIFSIICRGCRNQITKGCMVHLELRGPRSDLPCDQKKKKGRVAETRFVALIV